MTQRLMQTTLHPEETVTALKEITMMDRITMGPTVLTPQIMSTATRTVTEMSSSRNADTQTTMETLEAQREDLRELGGKIEIMFD